MTKASQEILNRIRGVEEFEGHDDLYKSCTVRLNVGLFGRVFALASMADVSLNNAMIELIQEGQAAVYEALTDEEKERCNETEGKKIMEVVKEIQEARK